MKLEHIYYFDRLKLTQEINQIRNKWAGLPDLDPIKDGYPDGMQKYCQTSNNDLILSQAFENFDDRNDVRNWLSDQVDKYKKFWDEDEKGWLEHTQNTLERSIYITPELRNNEMYQLIFKWCDKKLKDFDEGDWEWNSDSGLYDRINESINSKTRAKIVVALKKAGFINTEDYTF